MKNRVKHCDEHGVDYNSETVESCPLCTREKREAKDISKAKSAYYQTLVNNKLEENYSLKTQRGCLMEQIYFLRKSVGFLQQREKSLQEAIRNLEKNILTGAEIVKQLEDNQEFGKISEKVKKKNK